jgi:hypothetical protein
LCWPFLCKNKIGEHEKKERKRIILKQFIFLSDSPNHFSTLTASTRWRDFFIQNKKIFMLVAYGFLVKDQNGVSIRIVIYSLPEFLYPIASNADLKFVPRSLSASAASQGILSISTMYSVL